ncbi:hypothetical protein KIM67_17970 [Flagellimonas sp. 389]|uniref:hypothetical protein n=1 Tax=Flagellimonas sp. 389 TaxID=2835862 RepID=UPI001BD2C025|nr:hypothetical protein [Flagellimonas sp. 389]MBS9464316.1 hypothetical protein [Flagellimonas sp. 389]
MKLKPTKPSQRIIAVFLTLNFLTSLMPINLLYASNNGPTSPEAASFEPVDATDMVNLATGDFSYVMPLLNVPSPEGGYPLALSYHAGIGLDQEASWVGLGWNLNPGAINRSVSGVPDDWLETKKYSMLYNDIGIAKNLSFGVSVNYKAISLSTSFNYSSFKATGGETTYDFGVGGSVGVSDMVSVNGYLGTNGIGLGTSVGYDFGKNDAYNVNGGASLFQSFKGGGLSGTIGAGIGRGAFGTGISLSSKGSLSSSISIGGIGLPLGGGNNLSSNIHADVSGFAIKIPIPFAKGLASLDFSYQKTKLWAFDANYAVHNGALYAGNIEESYQSLIDSKRMGLDSYEALYEADTEAQHRNSNFSFMSYDSYQITAQGIGGTISPKLLEEGALYMPSTTMRTVWDNHWKDLPATRLEFLKPNDGDKNFSKSIDQGNVHFYFENEYTSYLKTGSGNWNSPQQNINYDYPTEFFTTDKIFDDSSEIDGELFISYNVESERLKKGRFIEAFTNEEINESESLIITPSATGFNRSAESVPEKGVGAFRVTTLDGKTYHYSLPVYHKAEFKRVANFEDDSEDKFFEQQQFEPYATHWLLTAITGPDYIDKNGNNRVDEQDYGYWVDFEYGKWSDGFAWRSPNIGFHTDSNTTSYSWGIKEVYYLDKVKTRTHTALFVKGEREDNKSYTTQISEGENPKYYNLPHARKYVLTPDNMRYFQGTHLNIEMIYTDDWPNNYSKSEFWFYAQLEQQKSLRLEKVILLKNGDAEEIQKHNNNDSASTYGGTMFADAKISIYPYGGGNSLGSKTGEVVPEITWHGEYHNNVLNTNDIDFESLNPKTLKTIDLNYDETYPLGREISNNINLPGKLTLNSISTLGKGGVQLIPPYQFDYYSKNTFFDKDDMDDWGYYKSQTMMYSLNNITTPLGSSIEITYENDQYTTEYASPTTYFDYSLEFKFEGTANGPKTLSFRNNPDVQEKYHVNFTEYFEEGQTTEIDVLFWHYTNTESNWIGDFATNNCLVQLVSPNLLVFSLPNKNKQWGREYENCSKKDWVFYNNEYNHVVDMTADWFAEKDENSCERPAEGQNRARYRIFAQKEPLNIAQGGGVRVKKIETASDSYNTKTVYNYTNQDNMESGVTSYAPSKRGRVIPYISELPNPMVIYEHVTTERRDANDNLIAKKSYQFNIPKPLEYTQNGVLVKNAFEINRLQDDSFLDVSLNEEDVDMNFSKFEVKDYSASIGRLVKSAEYNSENQKIYQIENTYLPASHDFQQGALQESFNSYKLLEDDILKEAYSMTSSSKEKIPNVLSETKITTNGYTSQQQFLKYDFFTGKVTESSTLLSNGKQLRSKNVPAYHKFPQMGSKVDNPTNKNMLVQQAMAVTEIQDGNEEWQKISSNITTWNPQTYNVTTLVGEFPNEVELITPHNVWRKHKTFTWNGETDSNGYYVNYAQDDDGFDWSDPQAVQPDHWKQLSEVTQYDEFSNPLEVKDINGNLAASKMGYGKSKTIATSNSGYQETFYSGAEDDGGQGHFGGEVDKGTASITNDAHTGYHALAIANGQEGFVTTVNYNNATTKRFKMSLWAKNDNHANVRFKVEGQNIDFNPNEKVFAGDWVQLNFYTNIAPNTQVSVTTANGNTVVDDFRLHPIMSSMTSYVYNQWDELTDILGPNNLATKYEYDEAGRLLRIYIEVLNIDQVLAGGFKKVREYDYTYKSDLSPLEDENNPLTLSLGIDNPSSENANIIANASWGSGQYEYRWSVKYCNDNDAGCPGDLEPTYESWTPSSSRSINTNCSGKRAVYWCIVRDMATQQTAQAQGNHKRGGCQGGGGGGDNQL